MAEGGSDTRYYNGRSDDRGRARTPFPRARLLSALAFALIAWMVFWVVVVIGVVQFVMVAVHGRVNEELRSFSINLIQYLWELIAFVTFVRDEPPFPIGRFPRCR